MKKKKIDLEEATDWDLREGMGILPNDIPLTQNVGCVGGKSSKSKNPAAPKK